MNSCKVRIRYLKPDSIASSEIRAFLESLLSQDEKKLLEGLSLPEMRTQHLLSKALVRLALSEDTQMKVLPTEWQFTKNPFGRPELLPEFQRLGLYFNVSHANGLVACLTSPLSDAGIDIEDSDRKIEVMEIANNHFAPEEISDLKRLPAKEMKNRFFEIWTLKESYIKARGMGLTLPLDQFFFDIKSDDSSGKLVSVRFSELIQDESSAWSFQLLRPTPRHQAAFGIKLPRDQFVLEEQWPIIKSSLNK